MIALTLVLVFAVLYLASAVGILPAEAVSARVGSFFTGGMRNYPVSIVSGSVVNMKTIGNNLCVLTDKEIGVYSPAGKKVWSSAHTYSKPALFVRGDRGVVFDRSGKGYMLIKDSGIEYKDGSADGSVLCADYGKSGNYAIASRGADATSLIKVFNKHGKVVFEWKCAYGHITAVALSENGKFAAVAALDAANGELVTDLEYFGFAYKEALNTQKLTGASVLGLSFTGGSTVTAFCSNGVYKFMKSGELAGILTCYSSELNSFSCPANGTYMLALAKYGSTNKFEISVFSASGKKKQTISASLPLISVSMSKKYIFALAENKILVYNLRGKCVSTIHVSGEIYSIFPTDKYIFLHSLNHISRCYSYGSSSVNTGSPGT